jgi:hypothetical protein
MRLRLIGFVAFVALLTLGVGGTIWWKHQIPPTPEALLKRLPTDGAVVAGIDVAALRYGGFVQLIAGSKAPVDPDYTQFVRATGFDYTRDLDYVMASFSPDGEYFFVEGRFDWPRIEAYVAAQKGACDGRFCKVDGSTPSRRISFFRAGRNLMAMAVAPDDMAADRLRKPGPQADLAIPTQPVFVSASAGALRQAAALSGAGQMFASALTDASRMTLTLGPSGSDVDIRLDAICGDAQRAGALVEQLQTLTRVLKGQAGQTDNDSLGSVLLSGTFDQRGPHVFGRWPVRRAVIAGLASGL